jgi:uncharacterized protein (DUF2164 family)
VELSKEAKQTAIASIQRYCQQNLDEPLGNLAAGAMLDYFLQELGPLVYNQAVRDVQERLQARVAELDVEIYQEEFDYWRKYEKRKK